MKICDATIRINDGGGTAPHLAGPPKEGARPLRLAGLATSPVDGGSYYAVTPRSLPRMTGEASGTARGGGGTLIPVYIQIP